MNKVHLTETALHTNILTHSSFHLPGIAPPMNKVHSNGHPDSFEFGIFPGLRQQYFFVNTAGTAPEAIGAIETLYQQNRIQYFFGPYSNTNAEAICDWLAANLPKTVRQCEIMLRRKEGSLI